MNFRRNINLCISSHVYFYHEWQNCANYVWVYESQTTHRIFSRVFEIHEFINSQNIRLCPSANILRWENASNQHWRINLSLSFFFSFYISIYLYLYLLILWLIFLTKVDRSARNGSEVQNGCALFLRRFFSVLLFNLIIE